MGGGIPIFGAGWFGVRARHGKQQGEYALFMPMTTEQATVGGRETYGEPKKIGAVAIDLDGDRVHAHIERMGFTLAEVTGTLGAPIDIAPKDKTDFYFKLSPSPDGKGFDTEPGLVHVHRHEEARDGRAIDGTLQLHESPIDPIVDIPIGQDGLARVRAGGDDAARRGRRARPRGLAAPVRAPALRRPLGAREEGLMSEAGR